MHDSTENKTLLKHPLWFYIKNHPRPFALGMIFLFMTNGLDAVYPLIMKRALDEIEGQMGLDAIGRTCLLFFAIMASLAITRLGWRVYIGKFHTYAAEHIRQKLFRHLTGLGPSFFQKSQVGELMSVVTNDVQSFRQGIGPGVLILADGVIIILQVLPIMLYLNWEWTLKTLVFLPLIPFLIWKVMKLIHTNYKNQQERVSEMTGVVQETIGGVRVIKSFAQEEQRLGLYNQVSKSVEKAGNQVARVDAFFRPVMEFGVTSGSVILLFVVRDDLVAGAISVGTFFAFHRYIQKMVWPMSALGMGISMMQKGFASFERIKEHLMVESDIPNTGTTKLEKFETLEFQNVSFKYPGSSVYTLQDINFKIQAGESLGVMGPVGAGKTTLLHLLTRLYLLSEGRILINGQSVETYTQESLRNVFLLIPQEPFLFSDSISDNIAFGVGEDITADEVLRMTRIVDLHNEIESLPSKYDSQLGERGVNLSGGQKQRLTIARGLIMKTPVLILDDSLSAVDTRTEKSIESELRQSRSTLTRIIVAHRLSSVRHVDKLLILKDGHVESFGTFAECLKQSPTLQTIVRIQGQEASHE